MLFPQWLNATLFVIAAVDAFLLKAGHFDQNVTLALGAVQVGIAALFAFLQKQTMAAVRSLRGR
jgi:hypothetical protein